MEINTMPNNVFLSVIIPVYNAEKGLSKCIQSVLDQSFVNYELILIDDGSVDECGKICDAFAEKDHRILAFHQKNKGVSAARNYGLQKASGIWVVLSILMII